MPGEEALLSAATQGQNQLFGAVQNIVEGIKAKKANKQLVKLFSQRKAFTTPKEVFEILQATQFNAQSGFGAETMDFLTNQADRAFATNTGTALRLGADPNTISGLDDQYLQSIMKIGADDSMLRLQNFDKFLNAKELVAQNKAAEWQSKENLLKDQMAAVSGQVAAATQSGQSGINLVTAAGSAAASGNLYGNNSFSTTRLPNTNLSNNNSSGGGLGGLTPSQIQRMQEIFANP